MDQLNETPEYLFESSWEVCNKVGGIFTVLSTKAHTLQELYNDKIIFIGPDLSSENRNQDFKTDENLFSDWQAFAVKEENLRVKVGRWDIPGAPPVILVDFQPFFSERDRFFFLMWDKFQVNSMNAYGDYDESCIFAYAVGKVIESFYRFYQLQDKKVTALFNEWMLGMAALYVREQIPAIATLFTTHATSIGRSIAGNDKPLYGAMEYYNGDQMAGELNMEAKHSLEKQAARFADCFTTVSDITATECRQLLDKEPDIVTPNGFERNFVPENKEYDIKRAEARYALLNVARKLTGSTISDDAILLSTSGRYEYRNKGIDVFIEAMNMLRQSPELKKEVVAFITVPAWVRDARADLKVAIEDNIEITSPLQEPFITHWLNLMEQDKVLNYIHHAGFTNSDRDKLKIIFVPCYLDGNDGIFNKPYYDILIGMDATVYPSYYEPWGYTPLESIAFGIPTITTNLAGFGMWAQKEGSGNNIGQGVTVINRTDTNYFEVAEAIKEEILFLSKKNKRELMQIRKKCFELAGHAEWSHFISFYRKAFSIALVNAGKRNS